MNRLVRDPYYIFWLSIPLLLLLGSLVPGKSFYINIHATYFVILLNDFMYLISMIFLIIGSGYWVMRKTKRKLSHRLNIIHILLTFGGIILTWILSQLYRYPMEDYRYNNNLTLTIYIIGLLVIIGQVVFPVNIIRGLILKPETSVKIP